MKEPSVTLPTIKCLQITGKENGKVVAVDHSRNEKWCRYIEGAPLRSDEPTVWIEIVSAQWHNTELLAIYDGKGGIWGRMT